MSAWVTPGVDAAKLSTSQPKSCGSRGGSTAEFVMAWPPLRLRCHRRSQAAPAGTAPSGERAELVGEGAAGRRLLLRRRRAAGSCGWGRGSSPRRLARSRRGSSPARRCWSRSGSSGGSHCCVWCGSRRLAARQVGDRARPRRRLGAAVPVGRRGPALASSAGTSQSRCGGSVTIATVPLLGRGRAASRTPIECLRAIRCTTGNPVCRPVRSSTSGTGPAKAAFSAATCSAPDADPGVLDAEHDAAVVEQVPAHGHRARRVPGGVVEQRRHHRADVVGGVAEHGQVGHPPDRDLGVPLDRREAPSG